MSSKRAQKAVFSEFRFMDKKNREHGKTRFRLKDQTLAKKTEYSVTTVEEARHDLRGLGKIEWIRTGRSNIYWLPESKVSVGIKSPKTGDRKNKEGLEKRGSYRAKGSRSDSWDMERHPTVEAFEKNCRCVLAFDVNEFASKHGLNPLLIGLVGLKERGIRDSAIDADLITGEFKVRPLSSTPPPSDTNGESF
jgi:hypothetical protein